MSNDKKERIWFDPPGVSPEIPQESIDRMKYLLAYPHGLRRWKMMFIGILYLFTGILLYLVINYSDIPVETIPAIFLWVGGLFLITAGILYKRGGEGRWG